MVPNVIERVWVQGTTTKVESLRGTAFTEEDGAHTFRIAGVDASGETVPLSGTVLAKILRADNITIDVSGTITDGVASVTMVGDCYHVPGRFSIVVYLSDGVTTIAIYAAVGDIYRATSDTELDSGTTVPSLVQLEAAYQNALSAAAAANTAATGAERVNVSMSKSGDTITFSATDRTGATTTETMSDQSEAVANLNSAIIHSNLWSDTALSILDAIGNHVAFTSDEGGILWNNLISELQNPTITERYAITMTGENYESSNPMTYAVEGRGYETVISPSIAYVISAITATMGETSISPIDNEDGTYTISISEANANITISVTTAIDPDYALYHVENLVLDGTQEPIETPLQFDSQSANGVTDPWTLCVRATGASNVGGYCCVFATATSMKRLSFYTVNSSSSAVDIATKTEWQLGKLNNNTTAIVITHEAGDNKSMTLHYATGGQIIKKTITASSGVAYLDYSNGQTPLRIGADGAGGGKFIGEINDLTIYRYVMSDDDIQTYITGGGE